MELEHYAAPVSQMAAVVAALSVRECNRRLDECNFYAPAVGRGGALSDTAIRPSVCPSVPWRSCPRRASALSYRHASCLQLIRVRTADPSADGRRSAASRTAIGGGISSRRPARGSMTCFYNILTRAWCQCGIN